MSPKAQPSPSPVAYAARHPRRVSALLLLGGCARGWRVKGHPALTRQFEALMRQGWGNEAATLKSGDDEP